MIGVLKLGGLVLVSAYAFFFLKYINKKLRQVLKRKARSCMEEPK